MPGANLPDQQNAIFSNLLSPCEISLHGVFSYLFDTVGDMGYTNLITILAKYLVDFCKNCVSMFSVPLRVALYFHAPLAFVL